VLTLSWRRRETPWPLLSPPFFSVGRHPSEFFCVALSRPFPTSAIVQDAMPSSGSFPSACGIPSSREVAFPYSFLVAFREGPLLSKRCKLSTRIYRICEFLPAPSLSSEENPYSSDASGPASCLLLEPMATFLYRIEPT